jgi:hypothetical protein
MACPPPLCSRLPSDWLAQLRLWAARASCKVPHVSRSCQVRARGDQLLLLLQPAWSALRVLPGLLLPFLGFFSLLPLCSCFYHAWL